jgi:hypothetical protein
LFVCFSALIVFSALLHVSVGERFTGEEEMRTAAPYMSDFGM